MTVPREKTKKVLALFDFDKTITDRDSFLPFFFFALGYVKTLEIIILLFFPFILCIIGFFPWEIYNKMIFKLTIKGWTEEKFNALAQDFYQQKVKKFLRKSALDEIMQHLKNNVDVSVVSASPEDWIKPFTDEYGINLIATKLEIKNGFYTGNIVNSCRGAEKVNMIKEIYDIKIYSDIYAYGDSKGDKEMLAISNHPHFRSLN